MGDSALCWFYDGRKSAGSRRPRRGVESAMNADHIAGIVVAAAMLILLVACVKFPKKF